MSETGCVDQRRFVQVDVFTDKPYFGNPVGVVLDAEGLGDEQMQRMARWANLSETAFVLPPTEQGADYRVRIFTTSTELQFAGHPTLGTAHAWLGQAEGERSSVVQECGAGLVEVRRSGPRLAFAAPPLVRSGPVERATVSHLASTLGIKAEQVMDAQWADNGPGWVALLLADAEAVLALRPGVVDTPVGAVGFYPPGSEAAYEVRAFLPSNGSTTEDPVTGSLNASLAQWLTGTGLASAPYVASQGTALGRRGRAHIERDEHGGIWVGGGTVTCVTGSVLA